MRTSTLISLLFLLAACGGAPEEDAGRIELRPLWKVGEVFRIREEREERMGRGPFPPAGEIEARTERTKRELHIYDEEIVEANGHRLLRTRRTYRTSVRGEAGRMEPTPLEGKTLMIANPLPLAGLGPLEVRVIEEGGRARPASPEERTEVVKGALRLAPTLLPPGPVMREEGWPCGRELTSLLPDGTARPVTLVDFEEGRSARVEWRAAGRLKMRIPVETRVTIRESLTMDLAHHRIASYRSVTEFHTPTPPEHWRRITCGVESGGTDQNS